MPGYVLAIDCGTQSLRAIIFDAKGQMLLANKQSFTPYFSKEPGWAEQDPKLYYHKLCEATRGLKLEDEAIFMQIDTVVVTTQRDTAILVDKEGEPLRPAILWADQRDALKLRKLSPKNDLALRVAGLKEVGENLSKHCRAHWVQDFEPEVWDKTHKYLQVSGYLNYRLTGEFKDSISNQIGHIPFEYKKFRWAKKGSMKADLARIERDKLVDLVKVTEIIGTITKKASEETDIPEGVKVIAGASDKGCETLGLGCLKEERAAISLGSQASIQTTSDRYYEVLRFIPPFPAAVPDCYNSEIQIYRGYWMISWFKHEIAAKEMAQAEEKGVTTEAILDEELQKIPPGSQGLLLQPYWGAAIKNPEARGAILGFSDFHTRIHIYRAIIEGIGFALYEGLLKIERKSGRQIKEIGIAGGGSQSDAICQITADIFKRPVYRVQTSEASCLGAALIGYVANGTYQDFDKAVSAMVHRQQRFVPIEKNMAIYDQIYHKVYKKIYPRMKSFYLEIKRIME